MPSAPTPVWPLDAPPHDELCRHAREHFTRPMAFLDAAFLGTLVAQGLRLEGEPSATAALLRTVQRGDEAVLRALWPALAPKQIEETLLAALDVGHPAMVRLCLNAGALKHLTPSEAHRPLERAAANNRLDLVELLQVAGAAALPPPVLMSILTLLYAATLARLLTPAAREVFETNGGHRATLAEVARDLQRPDLGVVLRQWGTPEPPPAASPLPLMPAMPSPANPSPSPGWRRPVDRWLGSKRSFTEALTRALIHDDAQSVRALLSRGLPVVSSGPGRASPLRLAVHHDAAAAAAVLLDAGAPLHETHGSQAPFPHALSLALLGGPSRVLTLLWGRSPPTDRHRVLQHALTRGNASAVAWALEHGASVHCPDDRPDVLDQVVEDLNTRMPGLALPTPTQMRTRFLLDDAVQANRADLIAVLRAHDAPLGPHTEAVACFASSATVRALLAHYPNLATRHSMTGGHLAGSQPLLVHAALKGRLDLIDLALAAGADPAAPGMVWVQSEPVAKAWVDTYPARCAEREAGALDALLARSGSSSRPRL